MTISARCADILDLLVRDPFEATTVAWISRRLGVSERTIRYDLAALSPWLEERGIALRRIPRKGIQIDAGSIAAALELCASQRDGGSAAIAHLDAGERERAIILGVLTEEKVQTIEELTVELEVSRTTVLRDLEGVQEWFARHGVQLERHRKRRWSLPVDEYRRRILLVEYLDETLGTSLPVPGDALNRIERHGGADRVLRFLPRQRLERCIEALEAFLQENNERLTDAAFMRMAYYLCVAREESSEGRHPALPPEAAGAEVDKAERHRIAAMLHIIGVHADEEASFEAECDMVAALLAASPRMLSRAPSYARADVANRLCEGVLSTVSPSVGTDLFLDHELVDGLKIHL